MSAGIMAFVVWFSPFGLDVRDAAVGWVLLANAGIASFGAASFPLLRPGTAMGRVATAFAAGMAGLVAYVLLCYWAMWLPFIRPGFE